MEYIKGRVKKVGVIWGIELFLISLLAAASALNYSVFIFPNSFAPAGLDGICTMIQHILGISMGYFTLLANIPLIILGFIFLDRRSMIKTAVYVTVFSVAAAVLKTIDLSAVSFRTDSGTSIVLAPVAAGCVRGIIYALGLKLDSTSGGTDIVAAIIKKKRPYLNFMNTIFCINSAISICSFFVFGMRFEPVICGMIYLFITGAVGNRFGKRRDEAVRFEIIASDAEAVRAEISDRLLLPATVVDAHGAHTGEARKMIICVVDKTRVPDVESVIEEFPESVVFKSRVSSSGGQGR